MSEPIWNKFLTERDKAVFGTSGYGARAGLRQAAGAARHRRELCVLRRAADADPGIDQALAQFLRRGRLGRDALSQVADREGAREGHSGDLHHRRAARRQLGQRQLGLEEQPLRRGRASNRPHTNVDGNEIVAEIAPAPQDIVIYKQKPSGFFGTNMTSYLTLLGCDSVIVTGTTTSGCVRATVLDAFSLNYRIALAEEGCFDRSQASHAINLCDMNAKYADVVKTVGGAGVLRHAAERHVRSAEGLAGTPVRSARRIFDGAHVLTDPSTADGDCTQPRSTRTRLEGRRPRAAHGG